MDNVVQLRPNTAPRHINKAEVSSKTRNLIQQREGLFRKLAEIERDTNRSVIEDAGLKSGTTMTTRPFSSRHKVRQVIIDKIEYDVRGEAVITTSHQDKKARQFYVDAIGYGADLSYQPFEAAGLDIDYPVVEERRI